MSDTSTATTDTDASADTGQPEATPDTGTDAEPDWKAEAEKWKAAARKHEDRAKTNAQAAKELETFRQSTMTEQERAVAQAKAEARTEALREAGGKLVVAEVRAAAAGRLDDQQLASLLDALNVSAFVTEDGDVDAKRVAKVVDGIAPKTTTGTPPGFPDLGQGARGLNGGGDMSSLIRRAAGR